MDFIIVTLKEKITTGKRVSSLQKQINYYLPVAGIKSISKSVVGDDIYNIGICDNYRPDEIPFEIGQVQAKLRPNFINVVSL